MSPSLSPGRTAGVGETIDDRYRVERVLGRGGMAYIVAATDLTRNELVAVKILHPEILREAEAVVRFEREARAAALVDSRHACRVLNVGRTTAHGPYLVMEHLEGEDLGKVVARGPLVAADAIAFVIEACDALASAHAHGIVHRDLKPANLFLARQPDGDVIVKLLDFGISKVAQQSAKAGEPTLTPTMRLMGSIEYMSLEQIHSAKYVDHRTDVWALGTILFELLTGRTPFAGPSVNALVINIARAEPPSLTSLCPDLPPELDPVVARCLRKELDARTSSVGRLAYELSPFAPELEPLVAQIVRRCMPFDPSLASLGSNGSDLPAADEPGEEPGDADATVRRDVVLPELVPPAALLPESSRPPLARSGEPNGPARDWGWLWMPLAVAVVLALAAALGWAAWTAL